VKKINYAALATEKINPASKNIDRVSIGAALSILNKEDAKVAARVWKQRKSIERAVKLIVASLKEGGRLFFIGAGTSGRLGFIEAAECPPTFNTPPSLIQAFMAGGSSSVFRSKEGAEDRGEESVRLINRNVEAGDVVVGIAASGVTAYVRDGLKTARARKAATILVTCNPKADLSSADVAIAVNTGPEVIAGSKRLKAGSATKMILNSLTVVTMAQLGKVLGNRMVDLQPRSAKLQARALGLVRLFTGVSASRAEKLLGESGGNPKTAILMAKKNIDRKEAVYRLKLADGHLHKALSFKL